MMARIGGSLDEDSLFGTDRGDLIRGIGPLYPAYLPFSPPRDFIQANGGNDTISGVGDVTGGTGEDLYSWVNGPLSGGTSFSGNDGNDTAVLHLHASSSSVLGNVTLGVRTDMGTGDDRLVLGENSAVYNFLNSMGTGSDEVFVLGRWANVELSEAVFGDDGDPDVVHVAGSHPNATGEAAGDIWIRGFRPEDTLYIYDSGLNYQTLQLRSTLVGSGVTITLPNGTQILIDKGFNFPGLLGRDNVVLVNTPLTLEERVLHGNGDRLLLTFFGSPEAETIDTLGRALLLNGGDDIGRGDATSNLIDGEFGNDQILGFGGSDTLRGGGGDDTVTGWSGNDHLGGGGGDNLVLGGAGNDTLVVNGPGDEELLGGPGRDRFEFAFGASGNKVINGGAGADVFDFGIVVSAQFRIEGFRPGEDRIDLRDVTNINYSIDAWLGAQDQGEGVRLYGILLVGVGEGELSRSDFII